MVDIKKIIYALVIGIVVTGFGFAADQRIDQRVNEQVKLLRQEVNNTLKDSQKADINRQIQFYLIKEQTTGLSVEDKINKRLLEQQLNNIK